jgi:molybdenum cofactor cytidylyltransferase
MPVDPGNLLLLARVGQTPVIGLPGCARSPKLNGFDWVLERLLADVPLTTADLARMGAGGLLGEIHLRPQPRETAVTVKPQKAPAIAAIVLAAGQSRRMGENKLLADVDREAMIQRTVRAVIGSAARPVLVVTGYQQEAIANALSGLDVRLVHNPHYADGLSTSLRAGLSALPGDTEGAIVCLGDMPNVTSGEIDRLIAAFNPTEGRSICVPTHNGKRGNPVLWSAEFFPEMMTVGGDAGAKHLIGDYGDAVCEVEMASDAVLTDIDTPEALAALRSKPR